MDILNNALGDINEKKNWLVDGQVVSTKYSDKLYQISMSKPDVWRRIKQQEYGNNATENQDQLDA